jgi:hypothetical protein
VRANAEMTTFLLGRKKVSFRFLSPVNRVSKYREVCE